MSWSRLSSASLLTAGLAFGPVACAVNIDHAGVIDRVEKRFPTDGVVDVALDTFDGNVEIRSWDRPEVLVEIEKRGANQDDVARIEVTAEQTGKSIHVDARDPDRHSIVGFGFFRSATAKFVATVPRKSNVRVHTSDGTIGVDRIDGTLELRTSDGDVKVVETSGDVTIDTGDGSVTVEDVTGRVDARTGDGNVHVAGMPSGLHVRTGDGSVTVRVRGGAAMTEDWAISTGDGSITAELPAAGFNAAIEADPGSDGNVHDELTLAGATGGDRHDHVLRGQLGHGGHTFLMRTGDGTIRLRNY
jgi:DUF4097 and DUF4098 domain-containing protein YvlB